MRMQSLPCCFSVSPNWGSVPFSTLKSGKIQKIKQKLDRQRQKYLELWEESNGASQWSLTSKNKSVAIFFSSGDKTVSFHQWWDLWDSRWFWVVRDNLLTRCSESKWHHFIPSSWLSFPVFGHFSLVVKGTSSIPALQFTNRVTFGQVSICSSVKIGLIILPPRKVIITAESNDSNKALSPQVCLAQKKCSMNARYY